MQESDQPAGETDELDTTPVDDDVVADTESAERETDPAARAAEAELDELNDAFDTVDAAPSDFGGHDPFHCRETATHLIGRGANDCKAGCGTPPTDPPPLAVSCGGCDLRR